MDVKCRSHQISSPGRITSREEGRNQVCSVQCLILLTEEEILLNNGISKDDNSPLLFAFDLGSFFSTLSIGSILLPIVSSWSACLANLQASQRH